MRFRCYLDAANEWRWQLKASNGNIIADSGEGYKSKSDCKHGIKLVQATDDDTPIDG